MGSPPCVAAGYCGERAARWCARGRGFARESLLHFQRGGLTHVRENYMMGRISAHLVATDDERADLLTKAMTKEDGCFWLFRAELLNLNP